MIKSTVEPLSGVVVDLTEKAPVRVLHVDDEDGFLKAAKQCLEMQGLFQVETASSVGEATEKMKKKTFDVIVSDYVMPGKSGLEFLKELRDSGNKIPFVLFTGKGREEVVIKALNLGADRYFNKVGDPGTVYGELAHGIRQVVESKRVDEALRDSEEKYRNLFENARDVTLTYDLKGNVTSINKAAVEYGFKKDEIIGKNILKFVPKKYWPRLLKELVQNARGKTLEGEIEINTPKGKKIADYTSNPIIIDNKVVGIQTILRDITERKKIEEALRKSEERYRELTESISDVFFAMDKNLRYTYWNKASEKLTGFSAKDAIGKSLTEIFPDVKGTKVEQFYLNVLRTQQPQSFVNEYQIGDKNFIFEINAYPVKDGLSVFVKDITERKKMEDERDKLLHDYGERIKELHCLYTMSKLVEKPGISLEEILQGIVNLLPPAYQYPDIACARVVFRKQEFKTKNFKETRWKQQADIMVYGKRAGSVEVYYLEKKPILDEDLFLEEERGLIETVAERLGRIAESKQAEEALRESEEKFKGIFENANDCMIYLNGSGRILDVNGKAVEVFGGSKEELLGKHFTRVGVFSPRDIPKLMNAFTKILTGRQATLNLYIKNKEGQKIALECSSSLMKIDDKSTGILVIARDTTEHKKILEELRSSEKRLSILFEFAPDAYYLNDLKGTFVDGNKAAEELTGYKRSELVGRSFLKLKLLLRRQIPKAVNLLAKNALGKPTGPDEFVLNRKDGTQVPVEIRTFPVKIKDQTLVLGIARDITERKKADEALGVSEEKYRNLFENARDVILTLDLKGNVTSINKSVTRYGFKEEEIIGKNLRKFVPKKYWLRLLQNISKISHGEPARGEIEINTPKGKIITEYQSNPISRGKKVIGIQSTLRNITERKHFEERLSALNTYSQKLNMTESMEAIYRLTLDAMEKTLGFEIAFFMVVDKDMLCVVDQRGYPGALSIKLPLDGTQRGVSVKVARTGKPIIVPDAEKEDDWVEFWPGIHSGLDVPVKIGRKVLGVIGVESKTLNAFGEKDRKLLEILASHAATAMSNLEYISQLKRTENTLKATLEKLETMNEKLSVVGKFTRHDARNKLSTITMNAFLAKQKLASDHEALEYLSEIESVCGQVERIFDFARIYEKLGMEELTYMDVEKNLEEACMLFSDLHGIKVVNDCRGLTVLADSLLRQLLYNLIDNSLKHGEKVSQIRMHYKEVGKDQLKMVYEDDGVGIPQAEKEKIFKEGYGKGTGYGLYLIRKICEVYSWTIQETGEQGKRAQFTITIPKTGENGKMNYKLH